MQQQYQQYSNPSTTRYHSGATTTQCGGNYVSANERVQSTRKVSSTILNEQYLSPIPQDLPTREIEVQGPIQEEIRYVPRKEIREIEKRVPKYEYEVVERIVEIPRVEYVDREVEKHQYVEVIREVKVPQIVDIPKEVIREVKIPKINYVEKVVEVPGQVIEVPKPYVVHQTVHVNRYQDKQVPLVVAQTIKPYIIEGMGTYEVDVFEYEPECVPVDVHVIKPVAAQIQAAGVTDTLHRVIAVPAAQYNSMLQQLNSHLDNVEIKKLPYLQSNTGNVQFLSERVCYTEPQPNVHITGLNSSNINLGQRTHSGSHTTYLQSTGAAQQPIGHLSGYTYSPYSGAASHAQQQPTRA